MAFGSRSVPEVLSQAISDHVVSLSSFLNRAGALNAAVPRTTTSRASVRAFSPPSLAYGVPGTNALWDWIMTSVRSSGSDTSQVSPANRTRIFAPPSFRSSGEVDAARIERQIGVESGGGRVKPHERLHGHRLHRHLFGHVSPQLDGDLRVELYVGLVARQCHHRIRRPHLGGLSVEPFPR